MWVEGVGVGVIGGCYRVGTRNLQHTMQIWYHQTVQVGEMAQSVKGEKPFKHMRSICITHA